MSIFTPGLIAAGGFFIFSLASGVWLSRLGKPLNILILTIHKLISVAAVILTGMAIYNLSRAVALNSFEFSAVIVSALLFMSLIITGALLSGGKPEKNVLLAVHKFTPLLTIICTSAAIFLLAGAR
jgi:hypothetical protein